MGIEKLSIKQLTIGVIGLFGALSIVISFFASSFFLRSALEFQYHSFARVIEIASQESMQQLRDSLHKVGSGLASNQELVRQMALLKQQGNSNLTAPKEAMGAILEDILGSGFVGVAEINLLAIRLYSTELQPITMRQINGQKLPDQLPSILYLKASQRNSIERLKSLYEFWQHNQSPYYSVMVPVGGLGIKGYMELVVDPVFNLYRVADILHMPVKIISTKGDELYQSGVTATILQHMHPVAYELESSLYEPVLTIVAYTQADTLKQELIGAQAYTSIIFLALTLLSLLLALFIFSRYLFKPLEKMVSQIKLITAGQLNTSVAPFGLSEFSVLANHFNLMTQRLQERTEVLDYLSKNDALTGIPNRRFFQERLEQEFLRAKRQNESLTLLILDIDFFKNYNDHYGHQQGDICIRSVAQCINSRLERPGDFVARYGGEEFVILLPNTEEEGAFFIAEQIRTEIYALRLSHETSSICNYVTVSIGGRVFRENNYSDSSALLKSADELLYLAKSKNRNCVIVETLESVSPSRPSALGS